MDRQIIYCMMTQNALYDASKNVEQSLDYVDHFILIDGGSLDDTIYYFRQWESEEPKLHFYIEPWNDMFSEQRNKYLRHADKLARPGDWVLVSDSDEFYEINTLEHLDEIADECERTGHTAAGFQCRSVSYKGPKRVWENLDHYWKHLFYKWVPNMRYIGQPHETLIHPMGLKILNTPYIYEHRKQNDIIHVRGARNCFVGGGGPNLGIKNPYWIELKQICRAHYGKDVSWHEFHQDMIRGNMWPELTQWMLKVVKLEKFPDGSTDGLSEHREFWKTIYRCYWPQLEPQEMRGVYIP